MAQQVRGDAITPLLRALVLTIMLIYGRKGWDVLLRAYLAEFKADEGVELHIVTSAFGDKVHDWKSKVRSAIEAQCGLGPDIQWDSLPRIFVTPANIAEDQFPRVRTSSPR